MPISETRFAELRAAAERDNQLGIGYDTADVLALIDEIEALRKALKPFSELCVRLDRDYPGYPDGTSVFFDLTHGHLRTARAFTEGTAEHNQQEPK